MVTGVCAHVCVLEGKDWNQMGKEGFLLYTFLHFLLSELNESITYSKY